MHVLEHFRPLVVEGVHIRDYNNLEVSIDRGHYITNPFKQGLFFGAISQSTHTFVSSLIPQKWLPFNDP